MADQDQSPETFSVRDAATGQRVRFPAGTPPEKIKEGMTKVRDAWLAQQPNPTDQMGLTRDMIEQASPGAVERANAILDVPSDFADKAIARITAKKAVELPQGHAKDAMDYASLNGAPAVVSQEDLPRVKAETKAEDLVQALNGAPKLRQFLQASDLLTASLQDDIPHLSWLEQLDAGSLTVASAMDWQAPKLDPRDEAAHVASQSWWAKRPGGAVIAGVGRAMFSTLASLTEFMVSDLPPSQRVKQWHDRAEYFQSIAGSPKLPAETSAAGTAVSKLSGIAVGSLPFMGAGLARTLAVGFIQGFGSLRLQGLSEDKAAVWAFIGALPAAFIGQDYTKFLGNPATLAEARAAVTDAVTKMTTLPTVKQAMIDLKGPVLSGWAMSVTQSLAERTGEMLDRANRTGRKIDASEWVQMTKEVMTEAAWIAPYVGLLGLGGHFAQMGHQLEAHSNTTAHDMFASSVPPEVKGREQDWKAALQAIYDDSRAVKMVQGFRDEADARSADIKPWDRALSSARQKATRWLDPEVFEKAVIGSGGDPQEWGARAAGDDGSLFRNAKQTGTMFPVPAENYLADLQPIHDKLRDGVALSADSATASSLKSEVKVPPPSKEYLQDISRILAQREQINKMPDSAEKKSALQKMEGELRDRAAKEHEIKPLEAPKPKAEEMQAKEEAAPSKTALDKHAEEQMSARTISQLDASKSAFKAAATKAEAKGDASRAALNRALEEARVDALKRGKAVIGKVSELAQGDASKIAHAASETHGVAVDRLLHAVAGAPDGLAQFSGKQTFDDALDALKLAGTPIEFDEDHIRRVVHEGTALADMTPTQAENVLHAIKNLTKASEDYKSAYVDGKNKPRDGVIRDDIAPTLAKGTGKPPPGEPGAPAAPPMLPEPGRPGPITKIMDFASRVRSEYANLHTLFHSLGRWGDTYRTRFIEALFHRDQLNHQITDAVSPLFKRDQFEHQLADAMLKPSFPNAGDLVDLPAGVRGEMPKQMTVGDMMLVRLQTGTPEGMRDYSRGWGVEPPVIERWFDEHLTKEQMDAVQETWRRLKSVYATVAEVHAQRGDGPMKVEHARKIFTKHGEYEGGWGGPRRLKDVPGALPSDADEVDLGGEDGTETGTEKVRVPVHSLDQFGSKLSELAHNLAFHEIARDGWQMIRDPEFRDAVSAYKGKHWLEQIEQTHRLISDGTLPQVRGTWFSDTLAPALKARVAHSAFGLNFLVTGGQIAHEPLAAFALGIHPSYVAQGMGKARTTEGLLLAQDSKFLPQYTQNMRRQLNEMIAQATGYKSNFLEVLNTPSMYVQEKMSTMLARDIWHMAYAKHIDAVKDHSRAVELADLDTSTAMPATNVYQQPAIVRDRMMGMFFLVRNFPGTVWNLKAMDDWDSKVRASEGVPFMENRVPQIGRRLGTYASLGAGLYLMGHGRNEEEQKNGWKGFAAWGARTALTEATYGAQITHMMVQSFLPAIMPGEKFEARNVRIFESTLGDLGDALRRDFTDVYRGVKDPSRPLDKAIVGLADAAARAAIPGGTQLIRYAQGTRALYRYERLGYSDFTHTPRTPAGAAFGVLAGPSRKDSTPGSDFDEGFQALFGGGK